MARAEQIAALFVDADGRPLAAGLTLTTLRLVAVTPLGKPAALGPLGSGGVDVSWNIVIEAARRGG